jgi:hypothetical protein
VLLKQFANARGHVGVVKTSDGSFRKDSIGNVSVVKDANTLKIDLGQDFSIEGMLTIVQNPVTDQHRLKRH